MQRVRVTQCGNTNRRLSKGLAGYNLTIFINKKRHPVREPAQTADYRIDARKHVADTNHAQGRRPARAPPQNGYKRQ